jgi:hypothetical protein
MSNEDEDASLAYVLSLQDEFDRMSLPPQNSSYDDDYRFALQLQADLERTQSYPDPEKWKVTQPTYGAPVQGVAMSDEEYARLVQMQESSGSGSAPTIGKGYVQIPGVNHGYGIMSPPVSPNHPHTSSTLPHHPYQHQNTPQWAAQLPPTLSPPSPPATRNDNTNRNIPPMPEPPPPPPVPTRTATVLTLLRPG